MRRAGPARTEVAVLVAAWLAVTALVAVLLVLVGGDWRVWRFLVSLLGIWATATGVIAVRVWPRSVIAQLLAPQDPRLAEPQPHGWLWLLATVAVFVVILVATVSLAR
jgi:hypothetical protein